MVKQEKLEQFRYIETCTKIFPLSILFRYVETLTYFKDKILGYKERALIIFLVKITVLSDSHTELLLKFQQHIGITLFLFSKANHKVALFIVQGASEGNHRANLLVCRKQSILVCSVNNCGV